MSSRALTFRALVPRSRLVTCLVMALVWRAGAAAAQEYTIVHAFKLVNPDGTCSIEGGEPYGLLQTRDGYLYGATARGGTADCNGSGSRYKMATDGTIVEFLNIHFAPCLEDLDGNLYGVSQQSVWRLTPDRTVTRIALLDADTEGKVIAACITQTADGRMYGMALNRGNGGYGTIFRLNPDDGTVVVLHRFDGLDGAHPIAALVEGIDGSLYGTSPDGGSANLGTLFRITTEGAFTLLHTFGDGSSLGGEPRSPLVRARDGLLYGLTQSSLYRVSLDPSRPPEFVAFAPSGWVPRADGLVAGSDGNLYVSRNYAISRISPSGSVTILKTGDLPGDPELGRGFASFIHGRDGDFYGVAMDGGPFSSGVIFRLKHPAHCDNVVTARHNAGTLTLSFTFRTETPSAWSTWVVAGGQAFPLWLVLTPAVSPAVFTSLALPNVPNVGRIIIASFLVNESLAACGSWSAVDTAVSSSR